MNACARGRGRTRAPLRLETRSILGVSTRSDAQGSLARSPSQGYFFNHGLQFLKLSEENRDLQSRALEWEKSGALLQWHGAHGCYDAGGSTFTERSKCAGKDFGKGFCSFLEPGRLWVNNGLTEHLRNRTPKIEVTLGTKISAIERNESMSTWHLRGSKFGDEASFGSFDAVVFSDAMAGRRGSPGHVIVNGAEELGAIFPVLDRVRVRPIFALMVAFEAGTVDLGFDAAAVVGSNTFQFVSTERAKPNYASDADCESFVALSTFSSAEALLLKHPQQRNFKFVEQTSAYLDPIQEALLADFLDLFAESGAERERVVYVKAQRWGGGFYANDDASEDLCYVDAERGLALCGDYCAPSGDAQGAILSGLSAGERIGTAIGA